MLLKTLEAFLRGAPILWAILIALLCVVARQEVFESCLDISQAAAASTGPTMPWGIIRGACAYQARIEVVCFENISNLNRAETGQSVEAH